MDGRQGELPKASHECATDITTFGAFTITVGQEEDQACLNENASTVVWQKTFPDLDLAKPLHPRKRVP
jgi:hypothetical protein